MSRVLVVDDNEDVRGVIRCLLEDEGYDVTEAGNGAEALTRFAEAPADAVVMDIIMPEKEGLETIRELKKIDANVGVIAISGGGRIGPGCYLESAQWLGAAYVFSKPLDHAKFLDAVRELTS